MKLFILTLAFFCLGFISAVAITQHGCSTLGSFMFDGTSYTCYASELWINKHKTAK
jgi:hypothetical protein